MLALAAMLSAFAIHMSNLRQSQIDDVVALQASARQLQSIWLEAETGQRGYLLTGNERFLQPYDRAKSDYPAVMARLQRELGEQPRFAERLRSLSRLQAEKSAEMDETVRLHRDGRANEANALVASEVGRATMDSMRAQFTLIDDAMAAETAQITSSRANWTLTLWASCVSALLISLLLAWRQLLLTREILDVSLLERFTLERSARSLESDLALKAGEARQLSSLLAAIADSTPDAVYAKDMTGRLIFANKATVEVIGKPISEIIGRSQAELSADPAEAAMIEELDRKVVASGEASVAEESYTTGGRTLIFLSRKAPLWDADGDIMGLVGISTDITARKHEEMALFKSDQRFKAAIDAVHGILWTNSADGEMRGEQPAWAGLTGQSYEEYQGYGWADAVHPDDAQPTIDAWKLAVVEKRPFLFEHRVRRRDGAYRQFALRSVPVLDRHGEIAEWVGVHLDITDERATQKRLAAALDQLKLALDAGETATWEINLETGASTWDDRLFAMWGMEGPNAPSLAETVELIHLEDRAHVAEEFESFRSSGIEGVLDIEFRVRRASDGQERWLAARGRKFEFYGRESVVRGTTRDITARKKREDQIRFLMGELTHRTKNILAVIQSIARQTARSATNVAQFGEEFSERINGIAASLDLLIKDNWKGASLLDLIRMQTGPITGAPGHRLRLEGEDVRLRGDAAQNLGLALHELSTNAAKHGALTRPEGYITLSWRVLKAGDGGDALNIVWKELGGPPVSAPTRKGFGHVVMDRLVKASLAGDSELAFEADGVRWSLTVPAEHVLPA